jgi:3-hydroxybutyryl-CoA dehydratase
MNLEIGSQFKATKRITDEVVNAFVELSGDSNPIHTDDEFAKKSRFGRRIAHGMISGALLSAVLGTEFGEKQVVYISQTMRFIAPVFIGDTITATATVKAIREDKPVVTVETVVTKQDGTVVVSGEAVLLVYE